MGENGFGCGGLDRTETCKSVCLDGIRIGAPLALPASSLWNNTKIGEWRANR